MSPANHDDELFRRLDRLMAMAKTIRRQDRRLVLSLESDLRALRTALHLRSDALVQRLNIAGTGSKAVAAYSRIASLKPSTTSATTIK
jgi:hypothetical protein